MTKKKKTSSDIKDEEIRKLLSFFIGVDLPKSNSWASEKIGGPPPLPNIKGFVDPSKKIESPVGIKLKK